MDRLEAAAWVFEARVAASLAIHGQEEPAALIMALMDSTAFVEDPELFLDSCRNARLQLRRHAENYYSDEVKPARQFCLFCIKLAKYVIQCERLRYN